MKKKSLIAVVSVFLLFGISVVALAGVEPTPFKNQLGAVENILNSANDRVVKTMENPPTAEPSPNLNGAVNRLEAINAQLVSVDDIINSIIEEVMGVDPTPFIPAFGAVRDAAQGIVNYISDNPLLIDEVPSEFISAVENVQDSAQAIVDNTQNYINQNTPGSSDCGIHENSQDCIDAGCDWLSNQSCTGLQ